MSDFEEKIIQFESARNDAMNRYFNARQGLSRTEAQERIFEAGFRMGIEWSRSQAVSAVDLIAAMREIYEVWAGSEGFTETGAGAYQQSLVLEMRDIAARFLGR